MSSRYFGTAFQSPADKKQPLLIGREITRSRQRDQLLLVAAILVNTGLWMFTPHEDPEVGSPIAQIVLGVMYLMAFYGVYRERKIAFPLARAGWPVIAIAVLAGCSIFWSDEAFTTLRRSYEFVGFTALSIYFICRLDLKAFLESFALSMTIGAAVSLLLILTYKDVGLMQDQYAGAWRGMYVQKNELGFGMVAGMLAAFCASDGSRGRRTIFWVASFSIMMLLLVGSEAVTSAIAMLAIFAIGGVLLWCRTIRSSRPAVIILFISTLMIIVAALLGFGLDDVLGVAGRDSSLTGRTGLWSIVIDAIEQRPILGYGYRAYFVNHTVSAAWDPGHAHNGMLEAALNYGVIGVLLVLIAFSVGITRTWRLFWSGRDRLTAWPLLAMVYSVIANLSESAIDSSDFRQLLFVAAFFYATAHTNKIPVENLA